MRSHLFDHLVSLKKKQTGFFFLLTKGINSHHRKYKNTEELKGKGKGERPTVLPPKTSTVNMKGNSSQCFVLKAFFFSSLPTSRKTVVAYSWCQCPPGKIVLTIFKRKEKHSVPSISSIG